MNSNERSYAFLRIYELLAERIYVKLRKLGQYRFTGLSGSGKSTVAIRLEHALARKGRLTILLDGDNIRHGLNNNLTFSREDRSENIRRIGEVSKLMVRFLTAGRT